MLCEAINLKGLQSSLIMMRVHYKKSSVFQMIQDVMQQSLLQT